MKFLIKQRVFSWADSYDIYDENGNKKYFVKAEFFAFGHQLHIYDIYDNEIGAIHEKLLTFMPKFEVEVGGITKGLIQKEFTFFKPKYDIDYNGWHIEGDFWEWNYNVWSGNNLVACITKEWLSWGDTYIIDVADNAEAFDALMLVIAIDAANCSKND